MEIFRTRLIETIKIRGISPARLARLMGKGESAVKDIIYGRSRSPGIEMVSAIAKELDCTVAYLIGEIDDIEKINTKTLEELDEECLNDAIKFVEGAYETMEINPKPEEKAEFIAFEYKNNVKRKMQFMNKKASASE
tara:strand:- start:498 stop:908 length:411 start_codon:yes stop_codon:yes gene_type:complete